MTGIEWIAAGIGLSAALMAGRVVWDRYVLPALGEPPGRTATITKKEWKSAGRAVLGGAACGALFVVVVICFQALL
jgi:hypothetical protein